MFRLPSLFNTPTLLVVREVRDEYVSVKLLMAAIIRRAAFDIALYRNDKRLTNRRLAVQATKWMFSNRDELKDPLDKFASFESLCEILDQDPKEIRRRTLELKATDVRKFDRIGRT
jgi:hypothetical protein